MDAKELDLLPYQRRIMAEYSQRIIDMALFGTHYMIDGVSILRDSEGNFIFICPRCLLEYTVAIDKVEFDYHCEVEACRYAVLRFKTTDDLVEQETLSIDPPNQATNKGGVR